MKNMKLTQRLLGGFGLLLAGMAVLGVIALGGLKQIQGYSTYASAADSVPGMYTVSVTSKSDVAEQPVGAGGRLAHRRPGSKSRLARK